MSLTFEAVLQDTDGPQSLCELCLAQVCNNLSALCSRRADGSLCLSRAPLFPQEMADQLLYMMSIKGRTLTALEQPTEILKRSKHVGLYANLLTRDFSSCSFASLYQEYLIAQQLGFSETAKNSACAEPPSVSAQCQPKSSAWLFVPTDSKN